MVKGERRNGENKNGSMDSRKSKITTYYIISIILLLFIQLIKNPLF